MKQVLKGTKVHLSIPDDIYNYFTRWATEDLRDEDIPVNESSLARKRAEIMVGLLKDFREHNDVEYLDSDWMYDDKKDSQED